jgi:hypothetical protein
MPSLAVVSRWPGLDGLSVCNKAGTDQYHVAVGVVVDSQTAAKGVDGNKLIESPVHEEDTA